MGVQVTVSEPGLVTRECRMGREMWKRWRPVVRGVVVVRSKVEASLGALLEALLEVVDIVCG